MNVLSNMKDGLRNLGFAHFPRLLVSQDARTEFLELARSLGHPVTPPGCAPSWPVVETRPASDASGMRPFDRREKIGWHNDFTTHRWRPRWTLMWIVQPDPGGGNYGAWRVASTKDVLQDPIARRSSAWQRLVENRFPFGYKSEKNVRYFKVLCTSRGPGLRFNRRALLEGSLVAHGAVPSVVHDIATLIEGAAERNASTLTAGLGDVLVVDNWKSLHDRLELSASDGPSARYACLCFIDHPSDQHKGITDPRGSRWN